MANPSALKPRKSPRQARSKATVDVILEQMGAGAAGASLADAVQILVHAVISAHRVDPQLHRVLEQEVLRPYATGARTDIEADMRALTRTLLQAHCGQILPTDLDLASLVLFHTVESLVHAAVVDGNTAFATDTLEQEICTLVLLYLGVFQSENRL